MVQPVYCPRCGEMPIRGGFRGHECSGKWPIVPQPAPVLRAGCSWGFILVGWGLGACALLAWHRFANAAETLPAVSPPTDWTGVGMAVGLAVLVVGVIALIQYWRRPGIQRGEAAFNKLYELLGTAHETIKTQATALEAQANKPPVPASPAAPTHLPAKFPADWN